MHNDEYATIAQGCRARLLKLDKIDAAAKSAEKYGVDLMDVSFEAYDRRSKAKTEAAIIRKALLMAIDAAGFDRTQDIACRMYYLDGMSYEEVASTLGLTRSRVQYITTCCGSASRYLDATLRNLAESCDEIAAIKVREGYLEPKKALESGKEEN